MKRYYSKSRVEVDLACNRKRYWAYEFNGTGLQQSTTPLAIALGVIIHDALAGIAEGLDIDEVAVAARTETLGVLGNKSVAPEQGALIEGW